VTLAVYTPDDPANEIRRVFFRHERYRELSPASKSMRLDVPVEFGRVLFLRSATHKAAMTLARPDFEGAKRHLIGHTPRFEDWLHEGPTLWIFDAAIDPGTSLELSVRDGMRALVTEGFAVEGQRVLFRRHGRIGWLQAGGDHGRRIRHHHDDADDRAQP